MLSSVMLVLILLTARCCLARHLPFSNHVFDAEPMGGQDDRLSIQQLHNNSTRIPKGVWSLLTLVRFPNSGCVSNSSTSRSGTCYTISECEERGGSIQGTCAGGFGVCCVFEFTCGGHSRDNCSYFMSPGFPQNFVLPSNMSAQCDLRISKCQPNICQIRLDFMTFELFGVQEGECQADIFSVTGVTSGSSLPQLCGSNSGQHVYLDIPSGTDFISLQSTLGFLFDEPGFGRMFEIKITQIECNSPLLAPPGCLQYFTQRSATITSFNLVNPDDLIEGYPINQNYGICIRKEMGYCSIRYTASGPFQYGISEADENVALAGDNCLQTAADGGSRDDFLIIPGGSGLLPSPETTDRYCGGDFVPITTSSMPYIVNVVSGDKFDGEIGFTLNYQQLPCAATG